MARWYAVQVDSMDDWGTGSEDRDKAIKIMMADDDYKQIAVIENDTCIEEIKREDIFVVFAIDKKDGSSWDMWSGTDLNVGMDVAKHHDWIIKRDGLNQYIELVNLVEWESGNYGPIDFE